MSEHKTNQHFSRALAASGSPSIFERSFAKYLDNADALTSFRSHFSLPSRRDVGAATSQADGKLHFGFEATSNTDIDCT